MAQRIGRRPWAVPAWSFFRVQLVRPPRSCIHHKAFAAVSTLESGGDSWPATPQSPQPRRAYIVKVGPLWEKPSYDPVHVLIGSPLIGRIWVAIKNLRARFPGPLGSLHPLAVLELAAVVHGDGAENLPEIYPHAALHAVQRPDHAFHGVIRHPGIMTG